MQDLDHLSVLHTSTADKLKILFKTAATNIGRVSTPQSKRKQIKLIMEDCEQWGKAKHQWNVNMQIGSETVPVTTTLLRDAQLWGGSGKPQSKQRTTL